MKKTTMSVLATLGSLAISTSLLATLDVQKQFGAAYPDAKPLAKCSTCHEKPLPKTDDHANNKFGAALAKTVKTVEGKKVYDFKAIEKADSDGDGVSNGDEIKKGTSPGDPNSK